MERSFELNERVMHVVYTYSSSLIKIAFTYVKNIQDAEEITQETYLAYLQQRPQFKDDEHEKAWLIRVAINKSKNLLKSSWFRKRRELSDDLSYMPEEDSQILQSVLSLEEKYRVPIHLYYYEGYSINEIAAILNARPATIGTRLARGRQILKSKIGGFDDEQ